MLGLSIISIIRLKSQVCTIDPALQQILRNFQKNKHQCSHCNEDSYRNYIYIYMIITEDESIVQYPMDVQYNI